MEILFHAPLPLGKRTARSEANRGEIPEPEIQGGHFKFNDLCQTGDYMVGAQAISLVLGWI
jgi:hypothetical protein